MTRLKTNTQGSYYDNKHWREPLGIGNAFSTCHNKLVVVTFQLFWALNVFSIRLLKRVGTL